MSKPCAVVNDITGEIVNLVIADPAVDDVNYKDHTLIPDYPPHVRIGMIYEDGWPDPPPPLQAPPIRGLKTV
jgi:hypothetical protein